MTVSSVAIAAAQETHRVDGAKRRALGWWTVLAMLLAWFGSLPLSVAYHGEPNDSTAWVDHWIVTLPTIVSLPAMLWFLWKVPAPRPSVGRVVKTVLLAPVFLGIGLLLFLFTLGIGSFVFVWILLWQTKVASPTMEEKAGA